MSDELDQLAARLAAIRPEEARAMAIADQLRALVEVCIRAAVDAVREAAASAQ